MKFKTGDKVRFLNEAIEGTITEVLSNARVQVMDSDGFSHVTEEKHLVRIEFVPNSEGILTAPQEFTSSTSPEIKKSFSKKNIFLELDEDHTVYAVVRLINESDPLTTDIELRIGNNTTYTLGFTIAKRVGDYRDGLDHAFLNPNEDHNIGIFSQDELYRFDGFEIQLMFTDDKEFRPRPPSVKTLQFNSSDFLNPEFKTGPKGYNDTLLMPLYSFSLERDVDLKGLLDKYREFNKEEEKRKPEKSAKKSGFTVLIREKVVDLHIEELVKEHKSMSNAHIISYQLNYFIYEMEQAILDRLHKITFIHGVGQGILKNAIKEELKKYPNIRYGEAPQEKFGYGATEVEFI